mmetsp:Transcript_28052/g.41712  ORF Transcript_28052/g.41712 Transcript_28052/m.41712 type:complete len:237 (-) Transcript_28052:45-755(-)
MRARLFLRVGLKQHLACPLSHLFAGHPVGVHVHQGVDGPQPGLGLLAADEHARGPLQVVDSRALRQELRVAQHLEVEALVVGAQHPPHALGRAHGHRALLHHDLVRGGHLGDLARAQLAVLDVGGPPGADARQLGGGVHRDEDDVALLDVGVDVRREEEVPPSRLLHNFQEARLVDGEVICVPSINLLLVEIYNCNLDIRAVGSYHSHGGPAHISSAHTTYFKRELRHAVVMYGFQ